MAIEAMLLGLHFLLLSDPRERNVSKIIKVKVHFLLMVEQETKHSTY